MKKQTKFYHKSASTKRHNYDIYGLGEKSSFIPIFSHNQYNEEDYDIFEDLWSHTLAGDVIDTRINYAMGESIKPILKWRNPKKHGTTDDQRQNKIEEKYGDILDELIKIDEKPMINMYDNTKDAARNTKVFGRCILAFEPGEGKPTDAIKLIHPRQTGRVFHHQSDWSISSVYTYTKKQQLTRADEMIYFVNMRNSPRFRTLDYGYSDLQRVAGQARTLREITEFDLIEIVKSMWAGYGIVLVDQENLTDDEKANDLNTVLRNLKPGAFSAITKQGEKGVEFHQFNLDPKVEQLSLIIDKMERMIIGHGQVPGPFLGREEDSNMATLYQKVRSFMHGPVRFDRRWIGNTLKQQWYERNIAFLDKDALSEVKIEVEFENTPLDSWMGAIDEISKLKTLVPALPDTEILKLADLSFLQDKISEAKGLDEESLKIIQSMTDNPDLKTKIMGMIATK